MPPMSDARANHAAVLLDDGAVLVIGGVGRNGNKLGTAEVFQDYRGLDIPTAPFTEDWEALRSREFNNILVGRAMALRDVIGHAETVLDDLELVLRLVEEAIAR